MMTHECPDLLALIKRVEDLERKLAGQTLELDTVVARKVVLRDEEGEPRALFAITEGRCQLSFLEWDTGDAAMWLNETGVHVMEYVRPPVSVHPDSGPPVAPNADNRPRLRLVRSRPEPPNDGGPER